MPRISNIGGGGGLSESSADALYLNESANLSDLDDVATARTNLGLVAGGGGDIWVEKAGDTMTGNLVIGDDHFLNVDGSVVFNETGANVNFRIESDTIVNSFLLVGSTGDVGIGTSPLARLHVAGSAFLVTDAATPTKGYRFRTNGSGLDLDFGGQSFVFSGFPNADFTGTQNYYLAFSHDLQQAQGQGKWLFKQGNAGAGSGNEIWSIRGDRTTGDLIVFNEDGADYDLRFESDGDANNLFLDGGNNRIGIGTAAPDEKLHVVGNIKVRDSLMITPAPATDDTASGVIAPMTAGASLVFGDVCYIGSDSKMEKADADAIATSSAVAFCLETIAEDAAGDFLFYGFIRDDGWAWTVGGLVYLSLTAGALTQTAPSATDDVVQVIGVATHADRIFFNPNLVQTEIV